MSKRQPPSPTKMRPMPPQDWCALPDWEEYRMSVLAPTKVAEAMRTSHAEGVADQEAWKLSSPTR